MNVKTKPAGYTMAETECPFCRETLPDGVDFHQWFNPTECNDACCNACVVYIEGEDCWLCPDCAKAEFPDQVK